jgi:hypothetical protein
VAIGATYFGDRWSRGWGLVRSVPATLGQGYPLENGNYGLAELLSTVTTLPVAQTIVALAVGVSDHGDGDPQAARHGTRTQRRFSCSFLAAGVGIALMSSRAASRGCTITRLRSPPPSISCARPTPLRTTGPRPAWSSGVSASGPGLPVQAAQQLSTVFTEILNGQRRRARAVHRLRALAVGNCAAAPATSSAPGQRQAPQAVDAAQQAN